MFCPNCGNNLNSNATFCDKCGNKVVIQNQTMTDELTKKSKLLYNNIFNKIKMFIIKYKKPIIIVSSIMLVLFLSFILFNKFYDFTKLSWDTEFGDYHIEYTSATQIKLKAIAFDKDYNEIEDIKYTTEDGTIDVKDKIAYWNLPTEEGTYKIIAKAPSGKRIEKTIEIIKIDDNSILGGLDIEEIDDDTADNDGDGITNSEEKKLNLNPNLADTDNDGIIDSSEINEIKTDPLKKDTDNDGLNDGDELDLGLEPLKEDSKGDGIKDGNRSITYAIDKSDLGINIEITGKGNIPSTTIDVLENSTFSNMDGLLDKVYNFYSTGTIDSAIVKIKYNLADIEEKGLTEDNLTLYFFNEDTKELEALPTTVDKENKLIIVTLKHFSKYVIGDKNLVLTNNKTQIMLVIDNSVSMYTHDQLSDAGYTDITGADGNDSDFKRLTLTNKLIDMFTGNYYFGVAEFSGNYVNLQEFTQTKKDIKNSVNSMNTKFNSNASGTNIISALNNGINEFNIDENNHYIILLTDGKNTSGSLSNKKETIISNAKEKNIKICVIGLGQEIDTEDLNDIAESTGCDYYNATDSSALDEIYSIVGADINYNLVDTDGDGKTDGTIIADSGFIVTRDGFNFENFGSNKSKDGNCYGMAVFANLYYQNKLPISLDKKNTWKYKKSTGYNLANTYFSNKKNLYDFKTTTAGLSLYLYDIPSDYRDRIEDDIYKIKKEYYNQLTAIGAKISTKKDKSGSNKFSKYESALLTVDEDSFNNAVTTDEKELMRTIWRLFILQTDDKTVSFSSEPDQAFNELVQNLNAGNPVVGGIHGEFGHAINLIKVIQDNNDSSKFKIEIYDNNYPGEKRYIEMYRVKYSKWQIDFTAWTNEYEYFFNYDMANDGIAEDSTLYLSYPTIE